MSTRHASAVTDEKRRHMEAIDFAAVVDDDDDDELPLKSEITVTNVDTER